MLGEILYFIYTRINYGIYCYFIQQFYHQQIVLFQIMFAGLAFKILCWIIFFCNTKNLNKFYLALVIALNIQNWVIIKDYKKYNKTFSSLQFMYNMNSFLHAVGLAIFTIYTSVNSNIVNVILVLILAMQFITFSEAKLELLYFTSHGKIKGLAGKWGKICFFNFSTAVHFFSYLMIYYCLQQFPLGQSFVYFSILSVLFTVTTTVAIKFYVIFGSTVLSLFFGLIDSIFNLIHLDYFFFIANFFYKNSVLIELGPSFFYFQNSILFAIKIYSFVVFNAFYAFKGYSFKAVEYTALGASILSIMIFIYQSYLIYVKPKKYGSDTIELTSVQQLNHYISLEEKDKKNVHVREVKRIYIPQVIRIQIQEFMKLYLYHFKEAQILCDKAQRIFYQGRNTYQKIIFNINMQLINLQEQIEKDKQINSFIREFIFFSPTPQIADNISLKLAQTNNYVMLTCTQQGNITKEYNFINQAIYGKLLSSIVFYNKIQNFMIVNPRLVYYDLYEDE
ncbi:hypothetical protein ABPG74_009924 [Tetrahymena malaccensis]